MKKNGNLIKEEAMMKFVIWCGPLFHKLSIIHIKFYTKLIVNSTTEISII